MGNDEIVAKDTEETEPTPQPVVGGACWECDATDVHHAECVNGKR